jgi:UDP-N-acetylglucosamine transferase subunit ALG13
VYIQKLFSWGKCDKSVVKKMIFVTLGSQKFQFNRLLMQIDELVSCGIFDDEIFAQIGYSDYRPKNYRYTDFMDHDNFEQMILNADYVITHGGIGVIFGAVKKGKKVIAVPRLAQYGEHVDDHQLQILEAFQSMDIIYSCTEIQNLGNVYINMKQDASSDGVLVQQKAVKYMEEEQQEIIRSIEQYIKG